MFEVTINAVGSHSCQTLAHARTCLIILGTDKSVEVVVFHGELIVQRMCHAPCPSQSHLLVGLIRCAEAILVGGVGTVDREEVTIRVGVLAIVDLPTISKSLDRLNFNIADSIEREVAALIVGALTVDQLIDWVEGIGVIVHPALGTGFLQVVRVKIVAILVINRYARIGTQSGRKHIAVLVANLDTLLLTMLEVEVFAELHHVQSFVVAVEDML